MADVGKTIKFCVDTSAWLDGWVRYYPPDVFPSLWSVIEESLDQDLMCSPDEVYREMKNKDDDVYAWIKRHKGKLLVLLDEDIQIEAIRILKRHPRLVDDSKNRSTADPFVIATAVCRKCIVVTGEQRSNKIDKPRIPDVCDQLGVRCIGFLDMVRTLGVTF